MKHLKNDDAAPQFKRAAAINAQEYHKKYWPTHSVQAQQNAMRLRDLAHACFGLMGSKVYMTAREGFITVKIDKPSVKTSWVYPKELAAMHAFVQQAKIEPVATKKNLEFRVPK